MAHFAQIGEDYAVLQVIFIANEDCIDGETESESVGIAFCMSLLGGRWVQTSYNANFRKNYAGIGFTYDESRDAFIPPKPYDSWLLIEETCQWMPPSPRPDDGKAYNWIEESLAWVEITQVYT
jgi:hypothetical protein